MNTILLLEEAADNVRFSFRTFRRNPGFALAAVLVLALGLGASTAMFSALDRILFRPLPYPAADRLVSLGLMLPGPNGQPMPETMPDTAYFRVWQPTPDPFEDLATMSGGGPCDLTEEQPQRLACSAAEASLLRTLGVRVFAGRDFGPEDDVRGAPRVVLLRYGFWRQRFGGDLSAIGRTISLDARPATIIGILPPDFEFIGRESDILYPQQLGPIPPDQKFIRFLNAVGRLKPGVTPQQAETAAQRLLPGTLASFFGNSPKGATLRVRSLHDRLMGDATRTAWLLLAAVSALLLIACVNVANLMLARMATRGREFAVRSALGAGKLRLARLALTESLLLASTAGLLGLAIAAGLLKVLVAMAPATIPKIGQASLDLRVLAAAAALAAITGIGAGVWPALSILRSGELHGSRITTEPRSRVRFLLVTAQIALTITMLSGSALLLRSLWNQVNVPLGFNTENVIQMEVVLDVARYAKPEQQSQFFRDLLARVRALPGTVAASSNNAPTPLDISMTTLPPLLEGQVRDPNRRGPEVRYRVATTEYFETYRIPIVSGRAFREEDIGAAEPLMVLSASLAQLLFPGQSALGKRLQTSADGPWNVVVGVAADVRNNGIASDLQPEMYLLRPRDSDGRFGYFAVRTTANPAAALLKQTVADLDPQLSRYAHADRRARGGAHGTPPLYRLAALGLRGTRSAARRGGTLWRRIVSGDAAHARYRCAHGSGSRSRRYFTASGG